jgi:hypothetical protein
MDDADKARAELRAAVTVLLVALRQLGALCAMGAEIMPSERERKAFSEAAKGTERYLVTLERLQEPEAHQHDA